MVVFPVCYKLEFREFLTALGIFGAWLLTEPVLFCWEDRQACFPQAFFEILPELFLTYAHWGGQTEELGQ